MQTKLVNKKYQEAIKSNVKENMKQTCEISILKTKNIIKYAENGKRLIGLSKKQNLNNLMSRDPKEFWNRLNMKSKGKPHNFSKIELSNHLKIWQKQPRKRTKKLNESRARHR